MNLEKLINGRSRFSEIIRFGIVGGIATLLQIGLYFVFLHTVGVKPVIATIISYAISFVFNFFLSSYFIQALTQKRGSVSRSATCSTWACRQGSWRFSQR